MGSGAQVCGVSGGPDWLFAAMLGGGLVALTYGLAVAALVLSQGQPLREPGRSRWSRVGAMAPVVLFTVVKLVINPGHALGTFLWSVILASPVLATIWLVGRRAKTSGVVPPARSAPFGLFWILLALAVLGLMCALGSLYAQVALGHVVPC